jgi:hypothetical protein
MDAKPKSGYITEVLERHQIHDEIWNAFIASSPQAAPYGCTWYLDVVWPGWKAIVVTEKDQILAALPFSISKKHRINYVFNPKFSQYVGLFFGAIEKKNATLTFSLKKRLVKAIVEALPSEIKVFNIKFAPEFDYPLPFHWAGYELHTRLSYWLDNQTDKLSLLKNFEERTRTYINKAVKSGLVVSSIPDIDAIVALANERNSYPLEEALLKKLWTALRQQKKGIALEVRDATGRLHAGLIYQQFQHKIIHLFSAFDAELGNQGGMSLAIWKSIETAGPEVKIIDFEGSMLEPVENFFRGFGTRPVPYLQIKKNAFPKPIRWLME